MSASIPVSIPVFTTLEDDRDWVLAEHQNTPNDEITALATLLGMPGAAQSHNVSFLSLLQNGIWGCGIKYSTTTAVIVEAGQVVVSNAGGTIRKLRSTTQSSLTAAANMDSGSSFTSSTAHYIYATGDTAVTTAVYKISTNASAPSGATYYRRIGGFYVDGSGNILFVWSDNRPDVKPGDVIYERELTSSATDSTATAIPNDNTKPQTASEGKQITALALVIVPTSTTDIVEVELKVWLGKSSGTSAGIAYIAKDSDADAIAAGEEHGQGDCGMVIVRYRAVPGSVSPVTYKAFFGPSGGTAYLNANNGGTALYNGLLVSHMKARVIKGALHA